MTAIERYQALLAISEMIVSHRDLSTLIRELGERLESMIDFEVVTLILYDSQKRQMIRYLIHSYGQELPDEEQPYDKVDINDSPAGVVWQTQQLLYVPDITQEKRFPLMMNWLLAQGIKSFCLIPLTTALSRVGAMGFGSTNYTHYEPQDLEFLQQVGKQVAVAVDNALNYQRAQAYQTELAAERDRLQLILTINNAIITNLDLEQLFSAITASLRRIINNDYAGLALYDSATNTFRLHALDFPTGKGLLHKELIIPIEESPAGLAFKSRKIQVLNHIDHSKSNRAINVLHIEGIQSICCVPLISHDRCLGTLNLGRRQLEAFSDKDIALLDHIAGQIAIAVENALAYRQIEVLKDRLNDEKLYLEDEIRTVLNFEEIVGESAALKRVLKQVEIVADTDSTVLIQGETGSGKELIARAVHNLSRRKQRTFVKMNCAAIPTGLLESELFGHEKGAFTGAISQKIGRFELADRGTLFLDEVGDIPWELQPKMLRVLQEQEFERLGSNRTIKGDVRLVAATNRDLVQMVADKEFRSDLYYRFNVFPITIPALRERVEDIPLLVSYFVQKYARRMNKRITIIPAEAMAALCKYHWPGNIRELQNFIERAVILSSGNELKLALTQLKGVMESNGTESLNTLVDAEKEHILRALKQANWVIGGNTGAAALLGMKRTTLQSKMQKLGISRPKFG